jgi:hypothetical protein
VPALNNGSPKYTPACTNEADMLATMDGHRVYPRYPDGREDEWDCDTSKHLRPIKNYYEEYGNGS